MKNLSSSVNAETTLPTPDYTDSYLLESGVAKTVTIPAGARYINCSSNSDVYYRFSNNDPLIPATVPSGDTTDGSGSELNITYRKLDRSKDVVLSVISEDVAIVTISYYS